MNDVAGAIAIIIVLVVALPVIVIMSGGVIAAVIGHLVRIDVDRTHEGSELIDLNG